MKLTALTTDHAEQVCDHWKHYRTNEGLVEYFRQVIRNFESSAITTDEGKLVAYICMQYNGSMANLFVDPTYHSLNLGVILLRDLTRKLLEKHHTAYGFIKTKDSDFITSCQTIGFSWVPQGSMSWVHYRPSVLNSFLSPDQVKSASRDVFLNAIPLSCNVCSGIPADQSAKCTIHMGHN